MTSTITNLAQWRSEHPPVARLAFVGWELWFALWALYWSAGQQGVGVVLRFKPRKNECHPRPL